MLSDQKAFMVCVDKTLAIADKKVRKRKAEELKRNERKIRSLLHLITFQVMMLVCPLMKVKKTIQKNTLLHYHTEFKKPELP